MKCPLRIRARSRLSIWPDQPESEQSGSQVTSHDSNWQELCKNHSQHCASCKHATHTRAAQKSPIMKRLRSEKWSINLKISAFPFVSLVSSSLPHEDPFLIHILFVLRSSSRSEAEGGSQTPKGSQPKSGPGRERRPRISRANCWERYIKEKSAALLCAAFSQPTSSIQLPPWRAAA
jgi:hypothetical protein